ncbi:MAG: hypothetical protein FWC17_00055 [Treponema sp.]|nr:hypothetical protein [Treponema sp.]
MNVMPLLLLIYSCFAINLVLQCALGLKGITESKAQFNRSAFAKLLLIFTAVIFTWFLFSRILFSLVHGIYIYVLLFPVSMIVYDSAEYFVFRYIVKKDAGSESIFTFPGGITAAASFICLNVANTFFEVFIMSFGFVSGIFLVNLVIREIRSRAALESVPFFLRGKPLVLVSMGILSLILLTASVLVFRMIDAG